MCKIHADFIIQPPEPLHPTGISRHFDACGMDVIGPIKPPSSQGHMFILAATNSFSKWAEAIPLKDVKGETVENLLKVHIIYRFSVPAAD